MRTLSRATVEALITPALEALGYGLWGCVVESQATPVLRVFMDTKTGEPVTVEDCAKASHQIKGVLAVDGSQTDLGDYILEVSSPGMDRQIFKVDQYKVLIGKIIKIRLRIAVDNQRNFQGIIEDAVENTIMLRTEKGCIKIIADTIERAHVVPDWKIEG